LSWKPSNPLPISLSGEAQELAGLRAEAMHSSKPKG
jgi:hypothetical protein